jgi:hypothetical protein
VGYLWVVVQFALFVAYGVVLAVGASASWGAWRWAGALPILLGAWVGIAALRMHGRKLTPLPEPNPALGLLRSGVYAVIRHPMYTGLLLSAFGLAIVLQKPLGYCGGGRANRLFQLQSARRGASPPTLLPRIRRLPAHDRAVSSALASVDACVFAVDTHKARVIRLERHDDLACRTIALLSDNKLHLLLTHIAWQARPPATPRGRCNTPRGG